LERDKMEETREEEFAQSQSPSRAPATGNTKAILAVLVTVAILIIAQLIATALLFSAIEEIETDGGDKGASASFASFTPEGGTSASLTFADVSGNPKSDDFRIRLSNASAVISYTFPSYDDGVMLIPTAGWPYAPLMQYDDIADNRKLDEGDMLILSNLDPLSGYEIHLILGATGSVLDSVSILPHTVPSVSFCGVEVTGTSSATVTFCQLGGSTDPLGLTIILEDSVEWGAYTFDARTDGTVLTKYSGSHMATITYRDLSDDGEVMTGDYLRITDLAGDTQYTIRVYTYDTSGELDHRTFTTQFTGTSVTSGEFVSVFDTSETTATAIFGGFTPAPPQPNNLNIVIWRGGVGGTYSFPDNSNGTVLALSSGSYLATITYIDHADNQLVDVGDELLLSGLDPGEDYVILLVWNPTGALLDYEVFSTPSSVVPVGTWGAKTVNSNTAVNVDFGKVNPEPYPVDLEIILVRNGTIEGKYSFSNNFDGPLILSAGADVGTLTYADLADNQKINIGDQLRMTNLAPDSDYTLKMIWGPTGDQITSTTFSTPA
jgi:hypothetical protein